MVLGFEQAQAEYEYKMMNPYDYEDEYDDDNENAYWSHVDAQMEDYKLGDY